MSQFHQLVLNIEKRPSMYLGQPSISNLRAFLSGYIFARRELNQPQTQEEKEFSEFQSWIKSKYRISSDQSWDRIILFFSEDEGSALETFFELFNEFWCSTSSSNLALENKLPVAAPTRVAAPNVAKVSKVQEAKEADYFTENHQI